MVMGLTMFCCWIPHRSGTRVSHKQLMVMIRTSTEWSYGYHSERHTGRLHFDRYFTPPCNVNRLDQSLTRWFSCRQAPRIVSSILLLARQFAGHCPANCLWANAYMDTIVHTQIVHWTLLALQVMTVLYTCTYLSLVPNFSLSASEWSYAIKMSTVVTVRLNMLLCKPWRPYTLVPWSPRLKFHAVLVA